MAHKDTTFAFLMSGLFAMMLLIVTMKSGFMYFIITLTAILIIAISVIAFFYIDKTTSEVEDPKPIATLQEQYASGELSKTEFDQKLDDIIEMQNVADESTIETQELDWDSNQKN